MIPAAVSKETSLILLEGLTKDGAARPQVKNAIGTKENTIIWTALEKLFQ